MPRVTVLRSGEWLHQGRPAEWPRPPDPRPEVSLVAWGRCRALWLGYVVWVDVDSWQARSRGGRLAPPVLYSRWLPAEVLGPRAGCRYDEVPRLRLDGPPQGWPAPPVGPDGRPWYGEHRVYQPVASS